MSVPVSSAGNGGDVGAICAQVAQALPKLVDNTERRDTTPPTDRTAAWGEPPVILRCGVERPANLQSTSQLNTVNGIDWLVDPQGGGHVFTTVGRAAYIEVVVPAAHDPQVGPLVDVAPAMQLVPTRPEVYPTPATPKKTPQSNGGAKR